MELAIIRREASGKEGKSHVLLLIINHLDSKITFENLFSNKQLFILSLDFHIIKEFFFIYFLF